MYGIFAHNKGGRRRCYKEWDVSQSEVSRAPAGDVHGTRPFSDTHLRNVFLVLSHFGVSALTVVPTKLVVIYCREINYVHYLREDVRICIAEDVRIP